MAHMNSSKQYPLTHPVTHDQMPEVTCMYHEPGHNNYGTRTLLTTCVMSLVLFLRLFNFVLLQARTGCSVRYCVLAVRELV